MFGRDAAAQRVDQPVHQVGQRRGKGAIAGPVGPVPGKDVEVDVAVAQMPEGVDAHVGHGAHFGTGPGQEFRHRGQRQADIVRADGADAAVGLGDGLAQRPQRGPLRLAGGHDTVAGQTIRLRRGKKRLGRVAGIRPAPTVKLKQHRPARRAGNGEGGRKPGLVKKGQALPVDQFKGAQRRSGPRLGKAQQRQRDRGVFDHEQRRALLRRAREQPEAGGRDHAQRALGPDQQVAQVVAAVVLAQALGPAHDRTVGHHRLDPQCQRARIAIAQHPDAAGIGAQKPADARAALAGQRQRKQPVGFGRGRLHVGQHGPGPGDQGILARVAQPDVGQPFDRQDQRQRIIARDIAPHQPGAAGAGQNRQPPIVGIGQQCRDLPDIARARDPFRPARPFAARFVQIARRRRG